MNKYIFLYILGAMYISLVAGCKTAKIIGGPLPVAGLVNGAYRGTAKNGLVKVIVDVMIENQKITKIELIKHRTWKGAAAEKVVPDRIIKHQSTRVDAVTGATVSSRAIMNAVQNAVEKAYPHSKKLR